MTARNEVSHSVSLPSLHFGGSSLATEVIRLAPLSYLLAKIGAVDREK